jgi:hypothetical protein
MNWEYRFPRSILRLYILFIAQNKPIGALAHLQIGRAYAMQGDTPKAKASIKISSRSEKTPPLTSPSWQQLNT